MSPLRALVILALALGAEAQSAKAAAAVPRAAEPARRIEGPVLSEVEGRPTFTKDVAPIICNRCVELPSPRRSRADVAHSYAEVRPWAKLSAKKWRARDAALVR